MVVVNHLSYMVCEGIIDKTSKLEFIFKLN